MALQNVASDRTQVEALHTALDRAKQSLVTLETHAAALRSKILAMDEAAAKVPVDVDVSALVQVDEQKKKKRKKKFDKENQTRKKNDQTLALQRAELASLETQYLGAEQSTFALHRDIRTVKEGNAELLRICDDLMRRIEMKSK